MSIMGLRMHVAVTGGRKRLDAEIEIVDVSAAGHIRDRLVSDPVKECEHGVESDENQRRSGDESRPGGRHAAMADIGPKIEIKALRDDFAAAKQDDPRIR